MGSIWEIREYENSENRYQDRQCALDIKQPPARKDYERMIRRQLARQRLTSKLRGPSSPASHSGYLRR